MINEAESGRVIPVRDIELHFWEGGVRPPPSSDEIIYVHKDRPFVSRMEAVLDQIKPRRMVEVGILDGGSTIYWQNKYQPECLIAFDMTPDAPHLTHYLEQHQLTSSVHPYFGVSQADGARLRGHVLNHIGSQQIDAVIDDASHQYAETRATVETLLPLVRPGGVYIIEDWAWGHAANWPRDIWADQPLLSPLLVELILICGHGTGIIDRVEVDQNFAVLWRGPAPLPQEEGLRLSDYYLPRGFSVAL
jgi:hypothetical protein